MNIEARSPGSRDLVPESEDLSELLSGTKPNCLFRFDASPEIGGGHAVRCMALMDAMRRAGWHCLIVCRHPTLATVPSLEAAGCPILFLEGEAVHEPEEFATRLEKDIDLLVLDHYERNASYETACREWSRHIAVIDDLPNRRHDSDILIDQTLGRSASEYEAVVGPTCHVLAGIEYAMLRPEFADARPAALKRRKERKRPNRMFVSFGAVDAHDLTQKVLDAVVASEVEISVDVVLGNNAPHRTAVEIAHDGLSGGGSIYAFVDDMAALMVEADFAVGAAGSAAWERCCLGLPTLMYVLADNQLDIADRLAGVGAAESLGRPDELPVSTLSDRIRHYAGEQEDLVQMSAAAASICDGRGAHRLAAELTGYVRSPQSQAERWN